MSPIGMTLVFVVLLGAFAWSAVRRWKLLLVGAPEPRFSIGTLSEIRKRVAQTLVYAIGQKKMPKNDRYRLAGVAHMAIFSAFMVLLLNSIMLWVRGFDSEFDFWGLLSPHSPVGMAYSTVKEISAFAAIVGSFVFVYYRVIERSKRMTLSFEGLLVLFIIITMMLGDFVYVGGHVARHAAASGVAVAWSPTEPFGSLFALMFAGMPNGGIVFFEHLGFWWHSVWVLAFLNLLPYSKHFHVLTVMPNVFAGHLEPKGKLPGIEGLMDKVENDEPVGINRPEDLTWKDILDLYTCTECGRCSDNCPAFTTGKKLSPKHFTLALRDHLYDLEPHYVGSFGIERPNTTAKQEDLLVHGDPPEGYHRNLGQVDLISDIIDPEVIWACTTCRACEEQCPVNISYVDKIVGMRRHEMMIKTEFPHELQKAFDGIEVNGNPWNLPRMERGNWASDLGFHVPLVDDAPNADVIYWVGCAANYDDQAKKVARAVAKLLHHAGVSFAIMGRKATCTGDAARRAGAEHIFEAAAEANVAALNEAGAVHKTVIASCPHCFNTLANEYPAFGGEYNVVHHTDFLNGLVVAGKLRPEKRVDAKVAYHDSCYLGRYNQIYDSPRSVLAAIPGVTLHEVEYWSKERGLCCGAGGAQMWKEEEKGAERVNNKRALQLIDTGADTIATACPFCTTMLTEGIANAQPEEEDRVAQLDIAELLERSIDFGSGAQ